MLFDRLEDLFGIEPRDHGYRRPRHHRVVEQCRVGKDMEERQRAHEDLVRRVAIGIEPGNLLRVDRQIGMREHRALRRPRRPAGILQQGQRLRVDLGQLAPVLSPALEEFVPAEDRFAIVDARDLAAREHAHGEPFGKRQHLRQRADDQRLERRTLQHLLRSGVELGDIDGDQQAGARIGHLLLEFLDRIERREIHHHRARHHRPVIGDDIARDVGQEEPDPVARRDPAPLERMSEGLRIAEQFAIGEGAAEKIQQRRIGAGLHRPREHGGQRQRFERGVPGHRMMVR